MSGIPANSDEFSILAGYVWDLAKDLVSSRLKSCSVERHWMRH